LFLFTTTTNRRDTQRHREQPRYCRIDTRPSPAQGGRRDAIDKKMFDSRGETAQKEKKTQDPVEQGKMKASRKAQAITSQPCGGGNH